MVTVGDTQLFGQAFKIRDLHDASDGAGHGSPGGKYGICYAGNHVSAAAAYIRHGHYHGNLAFLLYPIQKKKTPPLPEGTDEVFQNLCD